LFFVFFFFISTFSPKGQGVENKEGVEGVEVVECSSSLISIAFLSAGGFFFILFRLSGFGSL